MPNIIPGPVLSSGGDTGLPAYSGSPLTITSDSQTIQPDYQFILLTSSVDRLLNGVPTIADGHFVGQRVVIGMADSSGGHSITFQNAAGSNVVPIGSSLALVNFGSGFGEMVEFIWNGSEWNQVSTPSQNAIRSTEFDLSQNVAGDVSMPSAVYFKNVFTASNPGSTEIFGSDNCFQFLLLMQTSDVTFTHTPTITNAINGDGALMLVRNDVSSTFNATFQDESMLAGSNLRLNTSTLTLAPGDLVLFMFLAGDWKEITRSVKGWSVWTDISLLNGTGQLQYRWNGLGDVEVRGQVLFTGYSKGTPLAVALMPIAPTFPSGATATQWPIADFNNDESGLAAILVSDSKLYINTPATSIDPLMDFGAIYYNTQSF